MPKPQTIADAANFIAAVLESDRETVRTEGLDFKDPRVNRIEQAAVILDAMEKEGLIQAVQGTGFFRTVG